jgi:hypothetical protein
MIIKYAGQSKRNTIQAIVWRNTSIKDQTKSSCPSKIL